MVASCAALPPADLARALRPIGELGRLTHGEEFDAVGCLVLALPPVDVRGGTAGWEREERDLYLADTGSQLLCVRWSRYKAEPLPRLLLGHPIALLNAKLKRCPPRQSIHPLRPLRGSRTGHRLRVAIVAPLLSRRRTATSSDGHVSFTHSCHSHLPPVCPHDRPHPSLPPECPRATSGPPCVEWPWRT